MSDEHSKQAEQSAVELTKKDKWSPRRRSIRSIIIFSLLMVFGVGLILYTWGLSIFSFYPSTDNAYIRAKTTVISPQVSGYVTQIFIQDFEKVTKGQPLIQIDDRQYQEKLRQATANLTSQKANLEKSVQAEQKSRANIALAKANKNNATVQLEKARHNYQRMEKLIKLGGVSMAEAERIKASFASATALFEQTKLQQIIAEEELNSILINKKALQAAVQIAQSAVTVAQIEVDKTVIVAPADGQLSEISARLGQLVNAGSQLTYLVPNERWVVANFKEYQLNKIKLGQKVTFSVDALGHKMFTGKVKRIAPGTGGEFSLIKANNVTGNFIKIAQRIAVQIEITPGQPEIEHLLPGMSVEVKVR